MDYSNVNIESAQQNMKNDEKIGEENQKIVQPAKPAQGVPNISQKYRIYFFVLLVVALPTIIIQFAFIKTNYFNKSPVEKVAIEQVIVKEPPKIIQIEKEKIVERVKVVEKVIQIPKIYVNNVTKVFPATENLNYNYSLQIEPLTVVYTCSGQRYDLFEDTLRSFFKNNSYPIQQIIAIDDDVLNQNFTQLRTKFPNITWISTNLKVGQLYAIDIAYRFIKTQYYFHSQEDWNYIRPNFIENSLEVIRKYPKVSQISLKPFTQVPVGYEGNITKFNNHSGLSFHPSVKRFSVYKFFVDRFGGYSQYTKFRSFGSGAGNNELCLSLYILKQGYYGYQLKDVYIQHTGKNRKLPRIFMKKGQKCEW